MITIEWTNIKKDVDKQTFRLANIHLANSIEVKDDAQEDDSKSSLRFILRFAEEGVSFVKAAIRSAIVSTSEQSNIDSLTSDEELSELAWTFNLKDNVDEGSATTLIHKCIVDYILWRWCSIWLPAVVSERASSLNITKESLVSEVFRIDWCKKRKRPIYDMTDKVTITFE